MTTYRAATEQKALDLLDQAQDGDTIIVENIYQKMVVESRAIGRGLDIIVEVAQRAPATK